MFRVINPIGSNSHCECTRLSYLIALCNHGKLHSIRDPATDHSGIAWQQRCRSLVAITPFPLYFTGVFLVASPEIADKGLRAT
jgi:hypothetical protein